MSVCVSVCVCVCVTPTAFIYEPISMKVVSIDSFFPLIVPSRLRIFQGANRFPPTGGNAWGRGGQVWEKCIWQKIYSDKHCSSYRGYPLKKNFWPPLAPPFPPRKDLPPAHGESPQTLFSSRFGQMIYQMMWNPKFLFSSPLHFFEGCPLSPQEGKCVGERGEGGGIWEKCFWQKIYSDKHCSSYRGYPLKKNFWPPLALPFPPRKDLPPAHDESPQTLFSNRFWKMISQMMWNSKFLFSSSLHFFEGCTPSPQGGNAWGRGGNMRKMLLTENFISQTL